MDSVLTLNEVADYLKLSVKTLQKMVKNNEIPCTKIANQWRFSKVLIDDWLRNKMCVVPQNDLSRLVEKEFDHIPLYRIMDEQAMNMDLKSSDIAGVLTELSQVAWENKLISDKNHLLQKLKEREALTSTAIGKGIALPHLRNPSNTIVNEPKIVVGLSKNGVDFNSIDGTPTKLFLLILSDSEIIHLKILSKISRILRVEETQEKLISAKTKAEFLKIFMDIENKFIYGGQV